MTAAKPYYAENKFDPKDRFHQESVKTSILFASSGSKLLNHLRRILSLKNPTEVHMIDDEAWIKLTYDQLGEDLRLSRDTIYRKIKEFQKYQLLEFKKVQGFTGLLIRINEEVRLKLLEITAGIRSVRCREKIKKIRLNVWNTFTGWLSRRAAQMAEFAQESVRKIRTLRTENSDDTPYILNTRDLEEERKETEVPEVTEVFLSSSFNTSEFQEQPIQVQPVVSISEIVAQVARDFTNKQPAILQTSVTVATEVNQTAFSRQAGEVSPSVSDSETLVASQFGIQYMAHSWNMVAKELELNVTVNLDSVSQKAKEHANLAWDRFGREGWEKCLEMYQLSAYLQGKTEANGFTAFTFASVVDPSRIETIYSGKYTGGISVVKQEAVEHVTTLSELSFDGSFATQKKQLSEKMGAAAYRSWIVDPGVLFRVAGETLFLSCSQFAYNTIELRFKDMLLDCFAVKQVERG